MRQSIWLLSFRDWRRALWLTWLKINENNVSLVAAGVAFYGFLAFVPVLAAVALVYGLVADTESISATLPALLKIMPPEAAKLVAEQLESVVTTSSSAKGWGLLLAIGFSFFGAMRAASAIIMALNIAHEVIERRSFVRLNVLTLGLTFGLIISVILCVTALSLLALVESQILDLSKSLSDLLRFAPALIAITMTVTVVAGAYRYAPARSRRDIPWLTPGAIIATFLGLSVLGLFGAYVARFGDYQATYGALGAVVILLLWLWFSALFLCVGAALDVELTKLADGTVDNKTGSD